MTIKHYYLKQNTFRQNESTTDDPATVRMDHDTCRPTRQNDIDRTDKKLLLHAN